MFYNSSEHYTFSTGGLGITLNALGTDTTGRNYTQCFVVSGAKLYVYISDDKSNLHIFRKRDFGTIEGESDAAKANHYAKAYELLCYPTHFTTTAKLYVYAAIPRSEEAEQVATIVYPPQRIDVFGRVEDVNEAGEKVERQLGDPEYYYIDLQGRITSASTEPRAWEHEIVQGAILGYIIGDEAGITRAVGNIAQMLKDLEEKIEAMNFFEEHILGVTKAYQVDPVTGDFLLNETGEKIPVQQQAKDEDGNLLFKDADGNTTTEAEGNEPLMVDVSIERKSVKLKDKYEGLWAQGWISALGINPRTLAGGGGYCDLEIIWDEDYEEWMDGAAIEGDDTLDGSGIGGGGSKTLKGLDDTAIINEQVGDVLVFWETGNGKKWINKKIDTEYATKLGSPAGYWTYQSLKDEFEKYVTLATPQTITAKKTFTDGIVLKSGDVEIELSIDAEHRAIKIGGAAYSTSWLSALGINSEATQSFMSESRVNELIDAYVKSHELGKTYTFGADGTGNGLASYTQSGTTITFTRKSFVETANFTKETIEGILGKKYWANVEISDTSSEKTEPTFAKIHIGGGTIEWDKDNQAFRFLQAAYSESWISALGINKDALQTLSISGAPAEGQNAIVGYEWDPSTQQLKFNFGRVVSGDTGVSASWGTVSGYKAALTINTTTHTVLLDGALSGYLTSVSWDDINGKVPTWNQDTTGNAATATDAGHATTADTAAVADALNEDLLLGTLWGNDFHPGDTIDGDITLGNGHKVIFGESGENLSLIDILSDEIAEGEESPAVIGRYFALSAGLSIGGGPLIEYDADSDAYHLHGNLYADGWLSALGLNSDALQPGLTEDQVNFLIGQAMLEWADEFKIDVITDPDASSGNALTGYEWDAKNRQLKFSYGTISGGSSDTPSTGGGTNVKWGNYYKEGNVIMARYLSVGDDPDGMELVVLQSALEQYHPTVTVDWSKVPASLNTKASTAGKADTADKLTTARSLWGNNFDGSANIDGTIILGTDAEIYFGNTTLGRHIAFLATPKGERFWLSHGLQIGDGIIQWDDDNEALKFSSAIYSESWISALGANSATIDEVVINNKLSVGGLTTTKELTVGLEEYAGKIIFQSGYKSPGCTIGMDDDEHYLTGLKLSSVSRINLDAMSVLVKNELVIKNSLKIGESSMSADKWEKFVAWAETNIA